MEENQNQTTQNEVQGTPQAPEGTVPQQGTENASPASTPEQKPKSKLPNIPKLKLPPVSFRIPKKFLIIAAFFVVLLFVIIIVIQLLGLGNGRVGLPVPPSESPTPSPTIQPAPIPSSPYSNDPEVLEIEQKTDDLDAALREVNLREDTLRIPTLDWDIKF